MQRKIDTKSGVIAVLQHNSKKLSESPPCLQEKKPLQKDPSDPAKYADIFVNKKRERECLLVTKQSKTPEIQLLNSTLSLVFTDKELGESSGMGLKRHNGNPGKPVLDSLKIEAIKRMSITIASIIIGNVSHLLLSTIRFQIRYVMSDRRWKNLHSWSAKLSINSVWGKRHSRSHHFN